MRRTGEPHFYGLRLGKDQLNFFQPGGLSKSGKVDWKTLDVSPAALAEIAKVGFDPVFGARPLKRAIQQRIENPLSKLLLDGTFGPKDTIHVATDPIQSPGQFNFSKKAGEQLADAVA